ncbi:MAG: ZIP family metal transporter [Chitinophagales bacterium]|nr:ZIP family metal transporter [Chitinophagales bacterium]MDW8427843.1 ZIP family metal transporter [Chitinophagales bacterium]
MDVLTWQNLVLFVAPLTGGLLALLFRHQAENNYGVVLSFSGAFLFTAVLVDLFPPLFRNLSEAGLYLLAGFFFQILLEQLTRGIEHGHFPAQKMSYTTVSALIIGLLTHALLDGIPLAHHELMAASHRPMLYAISLHKIPEGFALAMVLTASGFCTSRVLGWILTLSLAAPLAVFFGSSLGQYRPDLLLAFIAFAVGSFLHVTTTVLYESEHPAHVVHWGRVAAIVAGAGLALLL